MYPETICIIPRPVRFNPLAGQITLHANIVILTDEVNRRNALYLRHLLAPSTGWSWPIYPLTEEAALSIRLRQIERPELRHPESYHLCITPQAITIEAPTEAGVFYGIQTLRQLLPAEIEFRSPVNSFSAELPCLEIWDWPRFSWRGFMLDEGRHFQGKQTILLTLELMAMQKLNILHWHLTEDQGWRIEVKRYPRLTDIGAYRPGTRQGLGKKGHDGRPHVGFYSQEELREIVAYAAERHITIIPEIEMPGHSLAALASYPEFSCTGGPFRVATGPGIYSDILCAGKEETFIFLQGILDEVLDIFPSPYIHLGGDEVPKKRWRKCPACQKRMRTEGLKDEHELQVWFTNRMAAYLRHRGRQAVCWNQVWGERLDKDIIIQYWLGNLTPLLRAAQSQGLRLVMSSYLDTYLDHSYLLMPLSRAYHYNPIPPRLVPAFHPQVLGLEFPLWTEWVPNRARLDYQTYPRLTALAETGWVAEGQKNYPDFLRRLETFLSRLTLLGVRYAPLWEAEPPKIQRWLGPLTLFQPQRHIAPPK